MRKEAKLQGVEQRRGLGLRYPVLRPAPHRAGRRRRRGAVRRHVVSALLQRRRSQGQQDAERVLQERGSRPGRPAGCAVLLDRRGGVPGRSERRGRAERRQRSHSKGPARRARRYPRVRRRRHVQRGRPRRSEVHVVPRAQPGQGRRVRPRAAEEGRHVRLPEERCRGGRARPARTSSRRHGDHQRSRGRTRASRTPGACTTRPRSTP